MRSGHIFLLAIAISAMVSIAIMAYTAKLIFSTPEEETTIAQG